MADLNKLFDSIVAGKLEPAVEVTEQIIEEKLDIQSVINDYMIKVIVSRTIRLMFLNY